MLSEPSKPIMEKSFDLETEDGRVKVQGMYEQQVRSLKKVFPGIKVVRTVVNVDLGRTAQRDREAREEEARLAARFGTSGSANRPDEGVTPDEQ